MKRYINAGHNWQTYKGVNIYDDGVFYIYTEPQGNGRVEFSNAKEAMDYIDDMQSKPSKVIHTYRVDYYNSVRQPAWIKVNAKDEKEAAKVAQSKLHSELWRIDEIVQLD